MAERTFPRRRAVAITDTGIWFKLVSCPSLLGSGTVSRMPRQNCRTASFSVTLQAPY